MRLKYCSITGADDAVNPADLSALASEFPFAEFGALLSPTFAGKPRYATLEWIRAFARTFKGQNRALHLCDEALHRFIARDPEVMGLMPGFRRIQLNIRAEDMSRFEPAQLVARVMESPQWQFILQYNKKKKHLAAMFESVPNHGLLFDESDGRGISPDGWDAPLPGHFCGYAGGINPGNVKRHLELVAAAAKDAEVWIDMESGVRTDNKFDVAKARAVLEIAKPYAS